VVRAFGVRVNFPYRRPEPGGEGGYQCTYDPNGDLVTSGPYRGTYDYVTPDNLIDALRHYTEDVMPHERWPNKYEDPDQTEIYCEEC
jgi:hypothetical protein